MNEERRPALVGRKTRRAPDSFLAFQQIRAGFEPGWCARSNRAFDANTRSAAQTRRGWSRHNAIPWTRRGFRPTALPRP
jgi:hypothetical protein